VEPIFYRNFINSSVFNFDELKNLYENYPEDKIEMINNNVKYRPYIREQVNNKSTLIFVEAENIKEEFKSLKKVFELKFPKLKKSKRWEVHIYFSYSGESTSFKTHTDVADNIIVQTEGLSKWHLPGFFNKTLAIGDMLWIPKGVEHGCVPLSKRISLSFAFWDF